MDKIIIKDLLIRGVIGISDREREQPQDILINIEVYSDISKAAKTDHIDDCVNYRTIAKKVIAYAEKAGRYTVEALSEDIATMCLAEQGAKGVRVRVEKPGAVRFSRSVGVEIERLTPEKMKKAYVLLGSNIQPVENMHRAVDLLKQKVMITAFSNPWETEAIGSEGPNFLNLAMEFPVAIPYEQLKFEILEYVEKKLGRVRTGDKFAARTMDLDVIIFDGKLLDDNLWKKAFIACPMAEIIPGFIQAESGKKLIEIAEELLKTGGLIKNRPDLGQF